ncbi:hypothetical protein BJY00DRAFT_314587 [Aspergillus carlsbadensis]|nr:hypothetical protein BJY00DRAFT_314587 [Aspergillus carlsbadensis]
MPASKTKLPKGVDRNILTGRRPPNSGEICIGMTINMQGHLEAGCLGYLDAAATFPFIVWVEPISGGEKNFTACTKKDLDDALDGTWADEPPLGELAFGWWRCGGILTKGYGIARRVCRGLLYPLVDPIPEKNCCQLNDLSDTLLRELLAEGNADPSIPEHRLRLLREAVAARDLPREVRSAERTIRNRQGKGLAK